MSIDNLKFSNFIEADQLYKENKLGLVKTPLLEASISTKNIKIFYKNDYKLLTNSFKIRGAYVAILNQLRASAQLDAGLNSGLNGHRGVVTRSAGNFAQAVAFIAKNLDLKCKIVMPEKAPKIKINKTASYGAEIHLRPTREEEDNLVSEIAAKENFIKLHPFNMLDVIYGQSICAFEILEQFREGDKERKIDYLFGPIGGGGFMAGVSEVFKKLSPDTKLIAVEPSGGDDFYRSFHAKKLTRLESVNTIADGLISPVVGENPWSYLKENIDQAIVVSDDQIIQSMREYYQETGDMLEPSGAVARAGAISFFNQLASKNGDSDRKTINVIVLNCGGNIESDRFLELTKL